MNNKTGKFKSPVLIKNLSLKQVYKFKKKKGNLRTVLKFFDVVLIRTTL